MTAVPSTGAAESPYKLPVSPDVRIAVTQGYGQGGSHQGDYYYGLDFDVVGGSEKESFTVVAARGGTVRALEGNSTTECKNEHQKKDGTYLPGCWTKANFVLIDHEDGDPNNCQKKPGTSSLYLHLKEGSVLVKQGQKVAQGQPIAQANNTGWSTATHLHFQVETTPCNEDKPGWWFLSKTQEIKFADKDVLAKNSDGIPRTGNVYVSDNRLSAQPPSPKPPTKPSGPLPGSKGQSASRTKSVSDVDWRNTQYTTDCQDLAAQPFTVEVHNGEGQKGYKPPFGTPPDRPYYIFRVQTVSTGDLTGDGRPEAAVLLWCSRQPSNFFLQEVQVFTDGPDRSQLLGQLPEMSPLPSGIDLPPIFDSEQFFIRSGQLVTGVDYYSATDSHASGPSVHRVLTWQWDGSQFIAKPEQPSSPAASEKAAVEAAIRGHYEAIGANNFVKAYSYFGPTFRNQVDRQSWVSSEKSNQITGATINSLKVNSVSGKQATATVDVSFQDKTGTPRFLITWQMVKEGGKWKLDKQVSGKRIS
jgi:murein DD-endopeptidase MepM/ murein hydrolase activator NlpD